MFKPGSIYCSKRSFSAWDTRLKPILEFYTAKTDNFNFLTVSFKKGELFLLTKNLNVSFDKLGYGFFNCFEFYSFKSERYCTVFEAINARNRIEQVSNIFEIKNFVIKNGNRN